MHIKKVCLLNINNNIYKHKSLNSKRKKVMKRFVLPFISALFFISMLLPITTARAISIVYEATDIGDTTPGQDLWQYTYSVSNYLFDTDYGFTIFFDYTLYSNLEDPPPFVNADWDVMVWQPDLSIPDDGGYDVLALVDSASLADSFTLNFVWLGSGSPGPQPFDVYDFSYNAIESGQSSPVPEPSTILLVGLGLFGLTCLRKKVKNLSN